MKRSYLEKVYFKKITLDWLIKFKKLNLSCCRRLYKKSGENIFKVLIQEGSVPINAFGEIRNIFFWKRKISNRSFLLSIKKTLSLKIIWFQRNFINVSKMQQKVYKYTKTLISLILIATKLIQLKKQQKM